MNPMLLLAALLSFAPLQDDAVAGRVPKETNFVEEVVTLPLDLSHGFPVVEAFIGDQGPFRMILDTGASVTVLESHMKAKLGLESIGKTRIGDPTNPEANEADIVELPYLRLGDAYFEDFRALAWERDMGLARARIDGIVGLYVFQDCLLTFDYEAGEVRIEQGELPPADGRRVLSFERGGHISLTIEVGGESVDGHLDSGNSGGLMLPGRIESELTLVPGSERTGRGMRASGPVESRGGTLDGELRVGGLVLRDPSVSFDPSLPFGNLGKTFFEQGTVSIDLTNGRLELGAVPERPRSVSMRGPGVEVRDMSQGRRRLGIEMALDGSAHLRVGHVVPGSLAAEAGLLPGDVLRSVNGNPVSPAHTAPISDALSTPAAFRIQVEREGETVFIDVPGEDEVTPESVLERLLGSYDIRARMFPAPGAEPRSFSGSATFERSHGGRFVREEFTLQAGGRELSGDAYIAWRPEAERYELTQIDGFSATTFWLTGQWDGQRLAFRSVPASRVAPRDDELRWEYRFEDAGVFVKEMLGPDANGELYVMSDYRYVPVDSSGAR